MRSTTSPWTGRPRSMTVMRPPYVGWSPMGSRDRSTTQAVVLVVATTTVLSLGFTLLGLPSAVLFAALLGGMAHALTSTTVIRVPPSAFRLGQALIGVTIGSLVSLSALAGMGSALL